MVLNFVGNTPVKRYIRIGVNGNNMVDKLSLIIKRYQDDIDLLTFTPYIKISNKNLTFADKVYNLEVKESDDHNNIILTYNAPEKITRLCNIDMQLVLEKECNNQSLKWQTLIFNVTFDRSIHVGEIIEREYPDIIDRLENQIASIEEQVNECVNQYQNKSFFPNVGKENCIYIDREENKIYRYDTQENKYFVIENNIEQITIINCNGGN